MQHAGRFFSSKTNQSTHTWFFFFFFSGYVIFKPSGQRWRIVWFIFFLQLLQLSGSLYFVSSEHAVFSQNHSLLGQFIFLKYQSSFSSSRVSASTALSPQVQKPFKSLEKQLGRTHNLNHPLGTSSHCSSFLWLWSSLTSSSPPAGESWLSSHHNGLFNRMLLSNEFVQHFIHWGRWAQLGTSLKTCHKTSLKDRLWAVTISHWTWARREGWASSAF